MAQANVRRCLINRGVQLGRIDTATNNWPTVLASCDYEDAEFGGMVIGRKTEVLGERNLPRPTLSTTIPT
jgi:hypothetical protein